MLVLASQSPRRSEILRHAGIPFTVRVAEVDESVLPGESPADYVRRLAAAKAYAVESAEGETVLGADTTVVIDGEILGKPVDAADARRMLARLAGRRHEVLTGICLRQGTDATCDCVTTGDNVIVCLVGENIRYTPGVARRVFMALDGINIRMISQGASLLNISFVVAEADLRPTVEALHREFFSTLDPNVFERNETIHGGAVHA